MSSLNVRNLSEQTHRALRLRAAEHGRSTEAEVRAILDAAVNTKSRPGLGALLAEIRKDLNGLDFDIPRDKTPAEPADFD